MKIAEIPKTELHVHIEAIASIRTLEEFAKKYNESLATIEDLSAQAEKEYESVLDFFEYWHAMNGLLQSPEDFEQVTYEYLENSASQNVHYVEFNINVLRQEEKGIDSTNLLDAIYSAQQQAQKDFGIYSGTLLSFSRAYPVDKGKYIVDLAERNKQRGVIGIDIAGDEKSFPNSRFIEVFKYAQKKEVSKTAHAGEGAKQRSILDAIENMNVSRIGHGVDAQGEPEVIELLKDRNITIELCPSSNVALQVTDSLENHPGKDFINSGIPVTLNTDDPTLLGITLNDEYERVSQAWSLGEDELLNIYTNGVKAAFIEEDIKRELLMKL